MVNTTTTMHAEHAGVSERTALGNAVLAHVYPRQWCLTVGARYQRETSDWNREVKPSGELAQPWQVRALYSSKAEVFCNA